MSRRDDYNAVLLEDIQSQIQRLAESLADVPRKVDSIDRRLEVVETDVKVIKAVVKDHNKVLNNHETRITTLEAA